MKNIFYCFLLLAGLASCKGEGSVDDCNNDSFDRGALLTNWADNIIIPSYTLYTTELTALQTAKEVFIATPNEDNLALVRSAWITAYTTWQNVSIYEIGQAENIRLRDYTNTYPLDESLVDSNISSGNYILSISTNLAAQGLPALDYLLNGLGTTDTEIITKYTSDQNAANYIKYLNDVTARLLSMATEVLTDWNGSYRAVFIANDCSTSTSALNKLTNDMIFNLEKITRTAKIGTPIDFFGEPPVVAPEKVEAFYKKDVSKELLIASITASKNLFNGKYLNSDTVGESLKSYLDELQIETGGLMLSDVINTRYDEALTAAQILDDNFYIEIPTNRAIYKDTRDEIHDIIALLKTNMISALDIKADYSDSDGD